MSERTYRGRGVVTAILGFLVFCVLAGCGVWWLAARIGPPPKPKPQITLGLRFGPRPKPKPQMTPWHPELGRRKAIPLLMFYLFAYGSPGWMLVMWATHGHFR